MIDYTEMERRNKAIHEVRDIMRSASGAPAANDSAAAKPEAMETMLAIDPLVAARHRIQSSFGHALLSIAIIPFVLSIASSLDAQWRLIFGGFGFTLMVVGALYIDRANASDKKALASE